MGQAFPSLAWMCHPAQSPRVLRLQSRVGGDGSSTKEPDERLQLGKGVMDLGRVKGQGKYPGHLSKVCELSLAKLGQHQTVLG